MSGEIRGGRLRALREERGEDFIETAAAVGIDRSHVSKMESGTKQPSIAVLARLAKHFDVSPDYLLGWSDDRLPRHGGHSLESADQRAFLAAYMRLPVEDRRAVERFVDGVLRAATPAAPPRGGRKRNDVI